MWQLSNLEIDSSVIQIVQSDVLRNSVDTTAAITNTELMKFLQAMNWLRTSLPRMAEVVAPLRLFLEELMAGAARRTKRVAKTALFLPPRGRRAG